MKKLNKLFAILFAVLGVTTLKAQEWTDKTSLLVNPSFESETGKTDLTSGWSAPSAGWTLAPSKAPSNSQAGVAASSCTISSGGIVTLPTTDEGNFFYVRTNWNNDPTFALSQVISGDLPAGLYRLTCMAASNSGNWSTSTFKLTLKEGDGNISTNSSLNKCSEWTEWTVDLYKTDPSTSLTIEAAMRAGSSGGGQHYQMLLDDFKLEYMSFDDIEAAGWPKPQVPGSNLKSFVGTSVVAALYNVGSDAFVTRGMTWATQAIATKLHNSDSQTQATSDRHHVKISAGDNGKVRFSVNGKNYLGDGAQGSTTTVYTDNGNTNTNQFIYSEFNEGTYRLKVGNATSDVDAFLDVAQPYGGQLTYANGQGFTEWAIIKFSDIENGKYASYKAKKSMYEVYKAVVDAGHSATYSDALSTALETYIKPNATASDVTAATNVLIKAVAPALTGGYVNAGALFTNPDMRGAGTKADWTSGYTNASWGCFDNWHGNKGSNKLSQTQTQLPNGFYKIVYHGIWRQDGSDAAPTLTLRSGDNSISANVPCMTDIAFGVGNTNGNNDWTTNGGKIIPNGMQSAGEALSHRDAQVTISDFVVSDGQLTIEMNSSSTSQWILAQGFDIYFKAESMEEYANLFNEAKSAADAIDVNTLNTYAKDILTTALNNAATVQINKEWYQARTAELNNAVTIANDVATAYPKASALLEICNEIVANSQEFVDGAYSAFSSAVNTAKTDVEAATTADAINAIYNTLESARQTYVQQADPTNGVAFDYTFLVVNPSFETGDTNGWTTSSGGDTGAKPNSNGTYTINGADGEFVFNTWGTNNMRVEQALKGIPTGLYTLKAIVASDADNVITLTAGNQTADITITTDKNTATEGVVETSYSSGDFVIKAASTSWFKADHFRLYYYGFDVATAQKGVTESKAKAEGLVGKPMNAGVASALQAAIDGADATKNTRNELSPMIEALNKAIADAEASVADYAAIKTYIEKADKIDESIAASYKSEYDNGDIDETATNVFQTLEVATYNYVTENFNYAVPISSTWNSTGTNTSAKEFNNEHWSGETRGYMNQNDDNGQGWNASAWSLDFDQDVTLPAGEYVFKVAGRKSADATLELVVTMGETILGTVSDFPNGSTGLGINKAGEASFDPNDAFTRNENTGFGWQWRYVRFELDTEAAVKVAVHAEANSHGQWVSFGDYTLQMTEETYLEANKGGLDAPTAAAEALVGTKPMGAAENDALKAALALSVTTGAELLAKIEALNTAVANANAWVTTYNEAKASLVAALERFEADYNKEGVKMSQTAWGNVLEKVKAAALAKDVTDSYDGFADAEKDLTDALAEADKSIKAYETLKAAIEDTKALASANVGEQPFQRPVSAQTALKDAIATAQAAYDAAEADATEVNALDEAVKAFNNAVLNAPAEGQRFYIKVATEGHGKLGNAWLMTLGTTGTNNPTGYGLNTDNAAKGYLAQAFIFTQVEGNLYNISIERPEGTVYLTYGSLNGSAAGWKNQQIQATTNFENKGEFKIEATAKEGVLKIFNTVDNNYIDCQDGGAIYTDTGIEKEEFAFELASEHEVTLTISAARWATLILPFNAELPEGVVAYSCAKVDEDGKTLILEDAENIVANTPYLVRGAGGTYDFSGYGLADKDSYTVDLFTGTYVDYETKANNNEYVLQKNNDVLGFYLVGENAQPTVKAYRCYMTYDNAAGAPMFRIGEDETTSIHNSELSTQDSAVVYDLMGRKVTNMVKGNMYIVNGKKVVVK